MGGILDRRFGENDPTMTPEEKALERFVREKQRGSKKDSVFDLEDAEDDDQLTHFGQSLSFNKLDNLDDFNEADLGDSDRDGKEDFLEERPSKRRRLSDIDASSDGLVDRDNARPERPKSKKEVMEEVIAKSKLHKYERQQAKEDDDDLRAELDEGLPDLLALVRGTPSQPPVPPALSGTPSAPNGTMNPDRMALLNGKDRSQADKEYDERLRQMAMDQRAKPTMRTLTEEEKLQQEAKRLKDLEEKRLRRMRGEPEENFLEAKEEMHGLNGDEDPEREEDNFGLGSGLAGETQRRELGVEDEDDFLIEDDITASGSEVDMSNIEEFESSGSEQSDQDDDDEEFVQGLLSKEDAGREDLSFLKNEAGIARANGANGDLAYTYRCPETHEDLLDVTKNVAIQDLPTVVQRIRALYHPKLAGENKAKLGIFAKVLVDHISYLANQPEHPPFVVLEALIRHIHSLAKTLPEDISRAFRCHLKSLHEKRPTGPNPGDLTILTAITSIFPTSDHFHQVATPAMLCMTRYLGQKIPQTLSDLAAGTYIVSLCLQYQRLSKRYIPEVVNYVLNTLWELSPGRTKQARGGCFPHHSLPDSLRLSSPSAESRQLSFWDVVPSQDHNTNQSLKTALINTHVALIDKMIDLWADKSAFCEAFATIQRKVDHLQLASASDSLNTTINDVVRNVSSKLREQLQQSVAARQPLRLHDHRPLAIKTSIPKFEESYNPDKHYDPDRDRAELAKLEAEHKRERKGALRELRKDANFIARESLREKKERDSAYEKKYKRLVAEIQGEEGREAKSYEREKRMRKGKK